MILTVQKIQIIEDWYSVINLANAFFSIPTSKESSVVCLHMKRIPIYIYMLPESSEFTSLLFDLVRKDLYVMKILSVIIFYTDDIIIETEEQTRTELNAHDQHRLVDKPNKDL